MQERIVRICVPVCVSRASDLAPEVARAAEVADLVEVRLDCLDEDQLDTVCREPDAPRPAALCPVILTLRPSEQGGHRPIERSKRLNFWLNESYSPQDFVDVEADLLLGNPHDVERVLSRLGQDRMICSHHDFARIPPDLEELYERMAVTPARILKIAVHADDATDCLPVFRLLDRAKGDGREMIAIAMGEAGIATRILGPSRGAFLTYGALDDQGSTAPGQLTAEELREVYRVDHINEQTEIMGLVGRPVRHSISPHLQNAAFADGGVNAVYIPFEVRDANAFMRQMVHPHSREIDWKLRGLSVTAPHKSAVMQHLDWIEPTAKEIGAVNTIVIEDSELRGYNTDAEAFGEPLRRRLGPLRGLRCAIIGAGGAARSAIWALLREAVAASVFARDLEKARELAEEFGVDCQPLPQAGFSGFDIVVNATPLGTRGATETETPAVAEQLRGVRLVYDLVYNPVETRLVHEAGVAGCDVLGGLEMLIAQAAAQFKLWTGQEADKELMKEVALNTLQKAEGRRQ